MSLSDITNTAVDILDKVSTPSSRSGSVVERVGKLTRNNVDRDVIALQMTKNSPNKQKYTSKDVASYEKLYRDAETKVVITAHQTHALIKDQQENSLPSGDFAG
jgi:tRNA U34 5-carboxymethylaminomethyl modifying enzyme MnmG/GidA